MATKSKPRAKAKARTASKKVKFGNRVLSTKLLVFIAIFAVVGAYILTRSFAAATSLLTSLNLDSANSVGATLIKETNSASKRNNQVVQLTNSPSVAGSKAVLRNVDTKLDTGLYKVCLHALSTSGTVTGNLQVTAYANGKPGTVLGQSAYSLAKTTDYIDTVCFGFSNTTSNAVVAAVVTNTTAGGVVRIGNVNFNRTGDIPPPPPPPPSPGTSPVGVPGNWKVQFSDEFNGSSLDQTVWQPNWALSKSNANNNAITKPVNSLEDSCYSPANVSVSGGSLQLNLDDRDCKAVNGVTYPYTGSTVTTYNRKVFSPDGNNGSIPATYFEARMKLPGSGNELYNWPAWWLDGNGLNHPVTLEFDIMEGLSSRKPCFTYHSAPLDTQSQCRTVDSAQWHTFGMEWVNGRATAYYDGTLLGSVQNSAVGTSPQFLILGNQIDQDNKGFLKKTPTQVLVDYVRVWARN